MNFPNYCHTVLIWVVLAVAAVRINVAWEVEWRKILYDRFDFR